MIQVNANTVRMSVDTTPKISGNRNSIRITSKNSYNSGLIILDLAQCSIPGKSEVYMVKLVRILRYKENTFY
jgi:hypothetical protein